MRNLDRGYNLAAIELPQTQRVCLLDAKSRDGFENAKWNDKVGSEDKVVLEVDTQAVWCELFTENVELLKSVPLLFILFPVHHILFPRHPLAIHE